MFTKLSDTITESLAENGRIESENLELCRYGVKQLLTILLNWITTLVIGWLFGMIWESIVFTAAYIPLRSYAGGFHAKTPLRCYVYSILMIAAVLTVLRFVPGQIGYDGAAYLVSGVVFWKLAPVEDPNKPLDEMEKRVFRRRTMHVWLLESAVILVLFLLRQQMAGRCVVLSMLVLSGMLIAGKIKNVRYKC